jgi:prepilin-type processing-associated H-X9-DG protein
MNGLVGWRINVPDPAPTDFGPPDFWRLYQKESSIPRPAKTWLFLDGHPDFETYGYWFCGPEPVGNGWPTPPGSFHNRGCGFGFVDGHAEMKVWRGASTIVPVNYSWHWAVPFDAAGADDFHWYLERIGFIDPSGQAHFGY